jgi:zinc protease
VPDNATLVVSGDFDVAQVTAWVEKYFGTIARGKAPIGRDIPQEPVQTSERRATDYSSNTPLPAVVLTYHVPKGGTPDIYALNVASNVLSNGESSRLYKRLVYDEQIALQAGGESIELEDPGVFFFYAIMQAGKKAEDGEKELLAEVDRLRNEPLSAEELTKSKNQLVSSLVFGRQTVQEKAEAIGDAAVIFGDVTLVNRELAEYEKVTAADVQRVARTYFRPENRTVVYMLPEAMKPPAGGQAPGVKP